MMRFFIEPTLEIDTKSIQDDITPKEAVLVSIVMNQSMSGRKNTEIMEEFPDSIMRHFRVVEN